jgi:hypothetical protein
MPEDWALASALALEVATLKPIQGAGRKPLAFTVLNAEKRQTACSSRNEPRCSASSTGIRGRLAERIRKVKIVLLHDHAMAQPLDAEESEA